MSAAEAIVAEFSAFGAGLRRDMFPVQSAFAIIDRCEKEGVGILGIEGFYLADGKVIPQREHILDLSGGARKYDVARQFLHHGEGLPLVYEFTLDD